MKIRVLVLMIVESHAHLLFVVVTVEVIQTLQIGDSITQVQVVIVSHVQVEHVVINMLKSVQAINHIV